MQDLLIDLDNTVYPEDSNIFAQIDLKMKSFIASEIGARRLLMLTDVKGVIGKNNKVISELKLIEINQLISKKIIYGGMIPKVKTCVEAVKAGIRASVILDGRLNNVILKELLSDKGIGTLFRK